jgi:ketosteroid isomerase-like protein
VRGPRTIAAGVVLLLGALTGCATGQEDEASATAEHFYRAVQDGDGAAACAVLAPRTRSELEKSVQKPCDQAILEEDIPAVHRRPGVEAFGTMAKLAYGSETAFLARFDSGWKVMAAACKDQPGKPYDCRLSGG